MACEAERTNVGLLELLEEMAEREKDDAFEALNEAMRELSDSCGGHFIYGDDPAAYFRGDLGDILCRAGRFEEGEQVFLQLIRDVPDSATGYVKLADALLDIKSEERARSLLEQAREKPDADDFDVARRLADFSPTSATTE